MAMRREGEVQSDLVVTWAEMPRSPGHAFYDKLQNLLIEAGFDAFVETTCKPYYAPRMGAPDAHGRVFQRDRQRARHCLALLGFLFVAGFPAACKPGQSSRPFLVVEDAQPSAA